MGSVWLEIAIVFVLVLVNAVLAGSEMAFVTLRDSQIERLSSRGKRGKAAADLARDPNRFLATVQVGITLAGFLASATAAVSLAEPLVELLAFLGEAAAPAAVVIVTIVLSYVSLVLGELAPKRVALQRAESWAVLFARPLSVVAAIARPVVWTLSHSTDLVVRLLGGDPAVRKEELSKDELREMVDSRRGLHKIERTIMTGAFEIAERTLREIAVPRTSIVAIPEEAGAAEALSIMQGSGISRAPVTREGIDDIAGVVHLRDLIGGSGTAGEHARPAFVVPETLSVMQALAQMQRSRTQIALVIDEYGGTEGLVTIEDILEEVVGEIYDEFDRDVNEVQQAEDGTLQISGAFPIHDVIDLGIDLPTGDYTTLGGLLMDRLGRVPDEGDVVDVGPVRLTVRSVAGRRIERIEIERLTDKDDVRTRDS